MPLCDDEIGILIHRVSSSPPSSVEAPFGPGSARCGLEASDPPGRLPPPTRLVLFQARDPPGFVQLLSHPPLPVISLCGQLGLTAHPQRTDDEEFCPSDAAAQGSGREESKRYVSKQAPLALTLAQAGLALSFTLTPSQPAAIPFTTTPRADYFTSALPPPLLCFSLSLFAPSVLLCDPILCPRAIESS